MNHLHTLADLTKYRLSLAVTFSAITGYSINQETPGVSLAFLSAGILFLSSGAAAMNQVIERDRDARMKRTMHRPIPANRIPGKTALILSMMLILSGTAFLFVTGILPALLGIATVILYNVVYTRLKPVSPLAIIPGALVGAIPPVIGFTAAGGTFPETGIVVFSLFMFAWQIPHFWLILIRYRSDYLNAGFKTISEGLVLRKIRLLVFWWVTITSTLLLVIAIADILFLFPLNFVIVALNVAFILLFHNFILRNNEDVSARRSFMLINSFSLAVMILFIINSIIS